MSNKFFCRLKIVFCMLTVRKISVPVTQIKVARRRIKLSFEVKATDIVAMMHRIICLSILFFNS